MLSFDCVGLKPVIQMHAPPYRTIVSTLNLPWNKHNWGTAKHNQISGAFTDTI